MVNPFEFHLEKRDAAKEEYFFRKMFEKYSLSDEESKKYREIGLEFNSDGSIASIRRNSEAEKRYEPVMLANGDAEYILDKNVSNPGYHVFVPRTGFENSEIQNGEFREAA